MNAKGRKTLSIIESRINDINEEISTIKDEEQEKHDNMPEGLQQGEKGEALQGIIDALENACEALQSAIEAINEAQGG